MHANRTDGHRTTIAVVGGINNLLEIQGYVEAFDHRQVIEHLQDLLRAVPQGAVADNKIEAAGCQIFPMCLRETVGRQRQADLVVCPTPALPFEE